MASLLGSVREVSAEVRRRVWGTPGYDAEHMRPEEYDSTATANLTLVIACIGTAGPVGEPATAAARAVGETRALQEVPIDALTQSWAMAERVVLDHLLAHAAHLPPVQVRHTVRRLGEVVSELTQCSITAYRRTQEEVSAHYDRLTADLVARLSGEHPADPEAIRRRANTVGSDPAAAHLAVAVGLPSLDGPAAYLHAQRHLLAALVPASQGRILVGSLDDQPLILVPTPDGRPERLLSALEECVADRRRPEPVVLGLSDHCAPLYAAGPVCRQAHLAMQVGMRLGWSDRVVRFGAVATEVLLVRNPDVADLLTERLQPLWQRPELVETIRVYLREGMSARATARELFVHPNTIQYRLKTIRRLLGRPVTDAIGLADVILALRGADLR